MPSISEVRQKYPQYQDLSDDQLADALHRKFYSDMPRDQFNAKIGLGASTAPSPKMQEGLAELSAVMQNFGRGEGSIKAEADKIEKLSGTGTFADMTGSGMAKGIPFADEIYSLLSAIPNAAIRFAKGEAPVNEYERSMQLQEELQKRRESRSPIASTAGAVAGGLGAAGPLVKGGATLLQGAKATLPSLMGRGAAEGSLYGMAYGAGEGRGLEGRAFNAGTGALFGGAAGGLTGGLARIGAGKVADDAIPSTEQLRAIGSQAYKQADDAGVIFTPAAVEKLQKGLTADFTDFGFLPELQPGAAAVLRQIEKQAGNNITLKGLDTLRKAASNAYIPGNKSNNNLVQKIISRIDEMMANPAADDVLMGDAQAGAAALKQARDAWARSSKAEGVQNALKKADLRAASTGSGGNADNATRQALRKFLETQRGLSDAERKVIEKAIRGGPVQNALRLVGKLSPSGNGLMAALGIGGTMVNPLVGVASLGGMGAKAAADAMTRQNVNMAQNLIRSGGKLPAGELSGVRKLIADALTLSGAQQLPGYTTPSKSR